MALAETDGRRLCIQSRTAKLDEFMQRVGNFLWTAETIDLDEGKLGIISWENPMRSSSKKRGFCVLYPQKFGGTPNFASKIVGNMPIDSF